MKTNLGRLLILLAVLAFSVSSVFAQEEASQVNSFTLVFLIVVGGIGAVALLGGAMWLANKEKDPKSD
jgi:drug/metabolite transporter (DMT)-like permease